MESKAKVLVVDDAALVRKMLSDAINRDDALRVVGVAANGKEALQLIEEQKPDVVTLDIEMPEMDGYATLRALQQRHSKIPVIMVSAMTERGAVATLDALGAGASDYVTKPSSMAGGGQAAFEQMRSELINKIRVFARKDRAVAPRKPAAQRAQTEQVRELPTFQTAVTAVGIAISTGGPNALTEIIPLLPENLGVPIFITQHMPPLFTRILAERLNQRSQLRVYEAKVGQKVLPNEIYIAPGDFHLEVVSRGRDHYIDLTQTPPENSCRPAADVMFRSLLANFGNGLLGVVMTGMGCDGLNGCIELKKAGGVVIAQNEESSTVWGMPGAVVKAGLADLTVALLAIPTAISESVRRASLRR